ncbi:MAG: hypothetical protein ACHQ9S_24305 [Candidatus Binatia bacterium]
MTRRSPTASIPPAADERPDEVRHIRVDTTPGSRRFVVSFVVAWFACCAIVLLLSLVVDPLSSYGTRLMPPLVLNDRDEKATAYRHLSTKPLAIILGSSRVNKFPPRCLEQLLGVPAFNFGLNSARSEDYLAVLRFAQAQGPVRRILLGIDPEAFHNVVPTEERLLSSSSLAPFVDRGWRPRWPVRVTLGAVEALKWESFVSSLRSIEFLIAGRRPEPVYEFDSTGFVRYPEVERLVRAGRYELRPHINLSVADYRRRYEGYTALSSWRVAAFDEFLRIANVAGTRVDAFIPPPHPTLVSELAQTTLLARTRETEALLSDYERRGLLHYVPLPTLMRFGGDSTLYFDGVHMMEANAVRLMNEVYRSGTCAVQ